MIDLSPLKPQIKGKPIAIVGLGKSGMPVFEACRKAGISCALWDDNEAQRQSARENGATIEDVTKGDFERFSLLCLSPGVPLTHPKPHPAVEMAHRSGVEIVGDIELFHRARPDVKTIGVTGTNGKSTTTALIGHILKESGVTCAVGGNIGEAVLTLQDLPAGSFYVLEMSSYQLDLCPTFSPDISVLINISPDHLDRHGDMAGYISAKKKIFRGPGVGIVGIDDPDSAAVYSAVANSKRKGVPVSCLKPLIEGVYVTEDGILFENGKRIAALKGCKTLQGQHNWQNAAMACAACRAAGVAEEKIAAALQSFPGLAHRQNIVASINGVLYINDSKATNDQAAAMALRAYNPIYWIAGGKPKEGGYKDCERHLPHIRHAFLIGQAEDGMAAWLEKHKTPYSRCGTLDRAVALAHQLAQKENLKGAAVVLSPACASFDQFRNFEHRGEVFVTLVRELAKAPPAYLKGGLP